MTKSLDPFRRVITFSGAQSRKGQFKMKHLSKLAITGAVFAFAFTAAAQAQSLRVSVPFKFHAGATVLPAGDYDVKVEQASQRITIVSLDGKGSCFLPYMASYTSNKPGKGHLVFTQYGGVSFLHRVRPDPTNGGFELFTTKAEREMAKANPDRGLAVVDSAN